MRISDWSSDVCSSDLGSQWRSIVPPRLLRTLRSISKVPKLVRSGATTMPVPPLSRQLSRNLRSSASPSSCVHLTSTRPLSFDSAPCLTALVARSLKARKSVVEGKSVSLRVDLGGRRYLKKKKKY